MHSNKRLVEIYRLAGQEQICPRNFLQTADSDIIASLHLVILSKLWVGQPRLFLCKVGPQISKEYRLFKFCCVPATSTTSSEAFSLFLLRPLTVLIKQTRQAVRTIKQSILFRCLSMGWALGFQPQNKSPFYLPWLLMEQGLYG